MTLIPSSSTSESASQPVESPLSEKGVFAAMRQTWQPVANSAALPLGGLLGYRLLETELVIARFPDGRLLAADVACPHKGSRLSAGCFRDGELMCAYHGWRFDAEGSCQSIPSLVDPHPEKLALSQLRSYPIQERYGLVWVKLDATGLHALPEIPEFENPEWTYVMGPPTRFGAGWRREVENYLDMSHFAFAHSSTLGSAADPRSPALEITLHPDGGYQMDAPFPALAAPEKTPTKLQSAHHRRQRGYLPNFTTIRQSFADGDERVLVHIPSPHDTESCTVFWSIAISPQFRGPPAAAQMEFAIRVLDEDRVMCELQLPKEVPINPTRGGWGVLVTPADTLANTFQKQLRRWLLAHPSRTA